LSYLKLAPQKILNVGCGNQMYGDERIDIVKTSATTKVYDITKGLPYKDNSFDEVVSSYVLEHMKNPYNLIMEMKRVCKKGGTIKIITDNSGYIISNTKLINGQYHGDYSDEAIHKDNMNNKDKHYAQYSKEHLRNFFESANIDIIRYEYFFWTEVKSFKSKSFHYVLKVLFGERFAQPCVGIIGRKK